jgi:hypothetical protein
MEHASNVPLELPIHHVSSFDFDDAFSDGDSNDMEMAYEFSPDAIREDLARNMPAMEDSWSGVKDNTAPEGFFEAHNTSVSTIDINGTGLRSGSHSPPLSSPGSPNTSSHFSQISLSLSSSPSATEDTRPSVDPSIGNGVNGSYPNIVIDASAGASTSHRISLTSEQKKSHELSLKSADLPSFPSLELASHTAQTAQSTRSLPTPSTRPALQSPQSNTVTPTPTSSPSPSTATFAPASLPSSSSEPQSQLQPPQKPFAHRPTRSAGPSAFEKVRSKTRPTFLPPKPRQEDDRHMADWQSMMKLSRAAG